MRSLRQALQTEEGKQSIRRNPWVVGAYSYFEDSFREEGKGSVEELKMRVGIMAVLIEIARSRAITVPHSRQIVSLLRRELSVVESEQSNDSAELRRCLHQFESLIPDLLIIHIICADGRQSSLQLTSPQLRGSTLYDFAAHEFGLDSSSIIIPYVGRRIERDRLLIDYGITSHSTVNCARLCRGS